MAYIVWETGAVTDVRVLNGPTEKAQVLEPAKIDGKPVAVKRMKLDCFRPRSGDKTSESTEGNAGTRYELRKLEAGPGSG